MAAPSAPRTDIYDVADRLWETADELRANSHLKAAEYAIRVLGLIFLKFADSRFTELEAALAGTSTGRQRIGKANYQAKGVLYLPEQSRFAKLLQLKEGDNLGKAINDAMAAIEEENTSLKGILPRTYQSLTNDTLVSLLRSVNAILGDIEGDAFGKVYEYFLGKFAISEGAKGGEYFTPTSIVRLIGRTMFIQSPPRVTHSAFTIRIRVDREATKQVSSKFLAYVLRGPVMREVLSTEAHGTNISNLNQGILSRLPLRLPQLSTQKKIVAVLSAYDDLIENNRHRIKILVEAAHEVYREWFVDSRAPGHEDVPVARSEVQGSGGVCHGQLSSRCGWLGARDPKEVNRRESSRCYRCGRPERIPLSVAFQHGAKLSVELYIDTQDPNYNLQLFN